MASESGLTSGEEKTRDFRALGATAVNVHVTRAEAQADSVVRLLDDATGIWFGGGDQSRLTAVLLGTKTETAIRRRYEAGAVVGGTSAGAAVMSAVMITGAERRLGGDRPPSDSSEAFLTIDRDNIVIAPGFGLLPGTIVDQHFVRRKRHNRLISLVLEHPWLIGIGVDESTALVVEPGGLWRVTGGSVVVVYDARSAVVSAATARLGGSGVRMHVLTPGSRYDPRTGRVELAGGSATSR